MTSKEKANKRNGHKQGGPGEQWGSTECLRHLLSLGSLWDIQAELSSQLRKSEPQKRDLSWGCGWEMELRA